MEKSDRQVQYVVITVIRIYQRMVSPMLGPRCRFYPSCSEYAIQALRVHGLSKGLALSMRRLVRCHPLNPGGCDPVPECVQKTDF